LSSAVSDFSQEGTTQDGLVAMTAYAVDIISFLLMIIEITSKLPEKQIRTEACADDFSSAGSIDNIKIWGGAYVDLAPYSDTTMKQQKILAKKE